MNLPLHIITIVLNGMPFITWHYPILRRLETDWHWWVVEGAAMPEKCTSWCSEIEPQLSVDSTLQYLEHIAKFDPRVHHITQPSWPGKVAMFNEALSRIEDSEFVLMQIDADEIWTSRQIDNCAGLMRCTSMNCAYFRCRYFVGPNRYITSREGFGNHTAYEWKRLWKVTGGIRFKTHEPPVLNGFTERPLTHTETESFGLVFDHYAYATEAQMRFKETYYNSPRNPNSKLYTNASANWRRLQAAGLPVPQLNEYFPWVGKDVTVGKA